MIKLACISQIKEWLLAGRTRMWIHLQILKPDNPSEDLQQISEWFNNLSQNAQMATLNNMYAEAYDSCAIENKEEREEQKSLMYERYLFLYRTAVENKETNVAKGILDSISKLLGLNEADKLEIRSHNIELEII